MPFEDELGEALRRAGDGFTADRQALVEAGERRGRRLVARRRAAVAGTSVLVLAGIGTGGAYTGGLLDPIGGGGAARVAQAPATPPPGAGAVTAAQMVAIFKSLLPNGRLSQTVASGNVSTAPMVRGLFDDGDGAALVGIKLTRIDPDSESAKAHGTCPAKADGNFDSCAAEQLPDGSRLTLVQGTWQPEGGGPVKEWRATRITPQGYLVEAEESNGPGGEKPAATRPAPPLAMEQLRALAVSPLWHPALADLKPYKEPGGAGAPDSGPNAALRALEDLVRGYGIPTVWKSGGGNGADVVLDDGKGRSMIQLAYQIIEDYPGGRGRQQLIDHYRAESDAGRGTLTMTPDGAEVLSDQHPREAGGSGVVEWNVDVLRPNGLRLIVRGYNAGDPTEPATRPAPALTMEQLTAIAMDGRWSQLPK
ncbi:hypothetical protein [Streptomyces sp. NPDC046161]|uniref:hypothetical protein n=1 Tax=Streptomyces sp. NPDC046161 TaxID=3155132 RepID=UPI0033CB7215